jgi:KipI family sensor histidine kinase inhibitor
LCEHVRVTLKALGDSAWLAEWKEARLGPVLAALHALGDGRPDGVLDVVPSFSSLAVYCDALSADALEVRNWMMAVLSGIPDDMPVPSGRKRRIPVIYDGEDLPELARSLQLTPAQLVAQHCAAEHTVAAVGFLPGFPYLLGCPEKLRVPRRSSPRVVVPAGSVAVAGGLTGIYPVESPGGWHLLGKTGVKLFDPHADEPAWLRVGDKVRFVPTEKRLPHEEPEEDFPGQGPIEVLRAGGQTSIQDLGRPGYGACGVSPGGAADPLALRVANLLAGNDEGAAALEICMSGPCLRFHVDSLVALVGADAAGWQSGRRVRVRAGDLVDIGVLKGSPRAVLAVAGGLKTPVVLGSRSTAVRAGFGGRVLRTGDLLDVFEPASVPAAGDWFCSIARPDHAAVLELRHLAGVQSGWFSSEARARLGRDAYQLTPDSDRMGARLSGPALGLETPRQMISQPLCGGSIQVPPNGQPIILMAERQTIGGYPQIGHVITADLPKLARAMPGTRIRFREVSPDEAREALWQKEGELAMLRAGLGFHT